jgi:hypothetical protein
MLTSAAITPTAIKSLTVRLTTSDARTSISRHMAVIAHPSRVVGFHPQPEPMLRTYQYKFDNIHPPMANRSTRPSLRRSLIFQPLRDPSVSHCNAFVVSGNNIAKILGKNNQFGESNGPKQHWRAAARERHG